MMGQCLDKSNELYTMWYKYHLKAKLEANADLKEEKEEMFNTGQTAGANPPQAPSAMVPDMWSILRPSCTKSLIKLWFDTATHSVVPIGNINQKDWVSRLWVDVGV